MAAGFSSSTKGSVVDWTISMGIFILAVTSIIALLQPGSVSRAGTPVLLDELMGRVMAATAIEIRETPMVIHQLFDVDPISGDPITLAVTLQGSGWAFTNVSEVGGVGGSPLTTSAGGTTATFHCLGTCLDRVVRLLYARVGQGDYVLEKSCSTGDLTLCDATLGSTVSFEGVDQQALYSLGSYGALKSQWQVPDQYDFGIYLLEPWQQTIVQGPLKQQGPVHADQRTAWFVSGDGQRVPIVLQVRVW